MVLDRLGDQLKDSLRKLFRASVLDPKLVDEIASDIKKALISADVNIALANKIVEVIKKRALAEKPAKALTAREHTINIVYDELVKFLGAKKESSWLQKSRQGFFSSDYLAQAKQRLPQN